MARALTGDIQGALVDFEFFIENSETSDMVAERQNWLTELKAGKNPFTPEVLDALKNE